MDSERTPDLRTIKETAVEQPTVGSFRAWLQDILFDISMFGCGSDFRTEFDRRRAEMGSALTRSFGIIDVNKLADSLPDAPLVGESLQKFTEFKAWMKEQMPKE